MDQHANNEIPGVPPPPAEVKVRTMKSDIASMQQSGGGLPQFQTVTVAGLAIQREAPTIVPASADRAPVAAGAPSAAPRTAPPSASGEGSPHGPEAPSGVSPHNALGITLVIIVALVAIAVVWYVAYLYLGK